MPKLLMISGDTALATGKKGAFYNTVEELHKYWDRIDIICPSIGNKEPVSLFENVFFHPCPYSIILQPAWIYRKGIEIYNEQKFDVMTVQEYPPFYNGMGAMMLSRKINVPRIEEFHHIIGYPKSANVKEFFYKFLSLIFVNFLTSQSVAVRVVNNSQVPYFLKKSGVNKRKIHYVPSLYIDRNIFNSHKSLKSFDLIFVGRLVHNKGIKLFIDVVEKTKLKALIVGDGPLKKWIEKEILRRGLGDSLSLYGWARDSSELSGLINSSKLLLMLSYNEGGPRVVVEAMSCKVPVLATPVGIVPDFIKEGYPLALSSWNSQEISNNVMDLFAKPTLLKQAEVRGEEIASRFEKSEMVKRYSDFLKSFIQ